MIGHARHVPSLRSSSCGGILGYAAMRWSFTLDLGMSVSLSFGSCKAFLLLCWAMLHLGILRLCWPYLRLKLSYIQGKLGCPWGCAVWFGVVSWLRGGVLVVCQRMSAVI